MSVPSKDSLEVTSHLKTMIITNAKFLHGGSINSRPRNYDVVTTSRARSQNQYRVQLVAFDEMVKGPGKVDVGSKILSRSSVKTSLNLALDDLLKKTQEELWKD